MTPREVPAVRTGATPAQLGAALVRAYRTLRGVPLPRGAAVLALAHSYFETGGGKSMWCWNPGNRKATPGGSRSWCYLPTCDEIVPHATADRWVASAPTRRDGQGASAVIAQRRTDGLSRVVLYPPHPADVFAAFASLDEGMVDHVAMMLTTFRSSWPALLAGDAVAFVTALKSAKYFTADLAPYLAGVRSIYANLLARMPADLETVQMPWTAEDEVLVELWCPGNAAALQSIGVCMAREEEPAPPTLTPEQLVCIDEATARAREELALAEAEGAPA